MTLALSFDAVQDAVELAAKWQDLANRRITGEEKAVQDQMGRLMANPVDKVLLARFIDQSFRSKNPQRVADQVQYLLQTHGVPRSFSQLDWVLTQAFMGIGRHFPSLSVPRLIDKMRQDTRRVIIPGEPDQLHDYLSKRRREGVRVNLNHLGEAVLGEHEARCRLDAYLEDLKDPAVEYISVKISTLYSQIHPLAFDHAVDLLCDRLAALYRAAKAHSYRLPDGSRRPKFVNLDMEEYRDLAITVAVFCRTLNLAEFNDLSAGIVLQAYLPDSYAIQQEITAWARRRVETGGAPIKIRIVKGANLEMERLEAVLRNWPLAPYDTKRDTDANYKRMLAFGLGPENLSAVRLGVASHNLFDLALAWRLAGEHGQRSGFDFEILEGMAGPLYRVLREIHENVIVYSPVAGREDFINAIAYLIRRLDENTGRENFLRYANGLTTGSEAWQMLQRQFEDACAHAARVPGILRRTQDRSRAEALPRRLGTFHRGAFDNEPDTDFSLAPNRRWAEEIRRRWKKTATDPPLEIPLVIQGEEIRDHRRQFDTLDPSQLPEKIVVARWTAAGAEDLRRAAAAAKADAHQWRLKNARERHRVLSRVAEAVRQARGDLIGAAVAGTGKIFTEADAEVSEAVDFLEYYPHAVRSLEPLSGVTARGRGVGLVIAPWNFPIAIPCGGIAAALAAGNTVIFKPSSEAVLPAWILCQCFWQAGVSRQTLQFVPCAGQTLCDVLVGHGDIAFVIFTGGTETGMRMLAQAPGLNLYAETGGKNATIVTAMADRDQTVKNVVDSAFSNSGQKCSATSLLILEREVYADRKFRRALVDAAASLAVGSAWNFETRVGPLIRPPQEPLKGALASLESGESWALAPRQQDDNPHLWSPGIKWGVSGGSRTHTTEFFGPLLGVMRADTLPEAVDLANATGYGLTAGLESLDAREQAYWRDHLKAGNLYINRGTTGAVVLRQPFGGTGKSALGPGLKAGGPDYVVPLMQFEETAPPADGPLEADSPWLQWADALQRRLRWEHWTDWAEDLERLVRAVKSCLYRMETWFCREMDFFHLRGQDNTYRYRPLGRVVVRLHADDTLFEVLARCAAAQIAGNRVELSRPPGLANRVTGFLADPQNVALLESASPVKEDDAALAARLPEIDRLRYAAVERVPPAVLAAAAARGAYIASGPVHMEGRLELLHYLRPQSICHNYHRYGNLGERAFEG
jgi:RHH-type proline utilization regulon transcriptional repressor/proline dehydrogenase/delta 1-pyrroline-5-carboxylate dehydrogenase